jgi:hypothetical protein
MAAHVFNLELQLVLGSSAGTLDAVRFRYHAMGLSSPTLKARCSKKCAVPLVLSVSALLPASIQTPTVEV